MGHKIQIKRGNESKLPKLDNGELALASDTKNLYIGTPTGNQLVGGFELEKRFNDEKTVNVSVFGAKGDWNGTTGTDDTVALQNAIDYAESIKGVLVFGSNKKYRITDSLKFNNLNIKGNHSTLVLKADKPILMSRVLHDKTGSIAFSTTIEELSFEGSGSPTHTNNHALYICSYWSSYKNLTFYDVGGNAIRLTHQHADGSVLATGTLVENIFENIIVRGSYGSALWLGSAGNNKITDGVLRNCIINTNAEHAIMIGSSAGWNIDGIHTYGTQDYSVDIANGFNTILNNIYVESARIYAISLAAVQQNVSISNVNVSLTDTEEYGAAINIDRQLIADIDNVSVSINNVNVHNDDATLTKYALHILNAVNLKHSNVSISGQGKANTSLSNIPEEITERFVDEVNKTYVTYEDRQLKQAATDKFYGNELTAITFELPNVPDYSKIIGTISINAVRFDRFEKTATWKAEFYLSWGSLVEAPALFVTELVAPTGFITTLPTVTYEEIAGVKQLTVTFQQESTEGSGSCVIEYVVAL